MGKKKWPVVLGLSVVASIAGSIFFKNKKTAFSNEQMTNLETFYTGTWWFIDEIKKVQHLLEIREHFTIFIDNKELIGAVVELTTSKLVIRDQYGYHLIITTADYGPKTLYDEADDITYLLSPK